MFDRWQQPPTIGVPTPFEERHHPLRYWAVLWGYSVKTLRQWFHDEHGPGILRIPNVGRRAKCDYVTLRVSPSAAARVYDKRTGSRIGASTEVM